MRTAGWGSAPFTPRALRFPGQGPAGETAGLRAQSGSVQVTTPFFCPGRLIQPGGEAGRHRPGARAAEDAANGWPVGCLSSSATASRGLWRLHHCGRCLPASGPRVSRTWLRVGRSGSYQPLRPLQMPFFLPPRSCNTRQHCWRRRRVPG